MSSSTNILILPLLLLFLLGATAAVERSHEIPVEQEETQDTSRSLQNILCANNVHYRIRAIYSGDPKGFNIGITHLGAAGEAEEQYVLNLNQDTVSTIQTRQGCLERNSLYRFVVYFPDAPFTAPGDGFELRVNDELIIQSSPSDPIVSTYTNYYFSGDIQTCPPDEARFRLKLRFGQWPQDISYKMEKEPFSIAGDVVLTHETSLVAGMTTFHPGLAGETLFVDKCIEADDSSGGMYYFFTIFSSASHGLLNDGNYEISVNGKLVDILSSVDRPQNLVQQWTREESFFSLYRRDLLPDFPSPGPGATMFPSAVPIHIIKPQQPVAESFLPDPPPPPPPIVLCLSGSTTVYVQNVGPIRLKDVMIGDKIAVEANRFEPVYSFGHWQPDGKSTEFIKVVVVVDATTDGKQRQIDLHMSPNHLAFVHQVDSDSVKAVPAASLEVGDSLITAGGERRRIVSVRHDVTIQDGMFAPFTPSGKFLVQGESSTDGMCVSSFVGFDSKSPTMSLFGLMDISYHWLAHTFEFPHRLVCYYWSTCPVEGRNPINGLSAWIERPMKVALWAIGHGNAVVRAVFVLVLLPLLLCFAALEFAVAGFHEKWMAALLIIMKSIWWMMRSSKRMSSAQ